MHSWIINSQVESQRQFIVLCGNITYVTVSNFLDDFFHPAREDVNCEVLILNKMSPDLEFEGLLKRERTRVQYFQVITHAIMCNKTRAIGLETVESSVDFEV